MGTAIEVRGLQKRYGDFEAVRGIDLDVDQGEILAFLGPNGAGKTTTIEILEGYRTRDAGRVRVLGADPAEADQGWREKIGIVLQESEPVPELTALESVEMYASYYRRPREAWEVLEIVGLVDSAEVRTRKLSGGQRRRLDLALALVGRPQLVFLDEPTTGFDPAARRDSWGMIEALRDLGTTVLLTTHYMDEAEQLADRIVVISGGEIAAQGTASELARQIGARPTISWRHQPGEVVPPAEFDAVLTGDDLVTVTVDEVDERSPDGMVAILNRLTAWAMADAVRMVDLRVARPTLEDVYLELVADRQPVDSSGAAGPETPATGRRSRRGRRSR